MAAPDLVEVQSHVRTTRFLLFTGDPMSMDLTTLNHVDQSQLHTKAIVKFERGTLTYCVAAPGKSRPADFTTQPRDGRTLVVLRRAPLGR